MTPAALDILNSIDRLSIDDKNELMVEVLRRLEVQRSEEIEHLYQGRFEELRSLIQVGIDDVNAGRTMDGKTAIAQLKQKNRDRLSNGLMRNASDWFSTHRWDEDEMNSRSVCGVFQLRNT